MGIERNHEEREGHEARIGLVGFVFLVVSL